MQETNEQDAGAPVFDEQDELYEHFSVRVDRGQAMLRVDKYLTARLENASRNRIQAAADGGNILVNGIPVKASYRVKPLDEVPILVVWSRSCPRIFL